MGTAVGGGPGPSSIDFTSLVVLMLACSNENTQKPTRSQRKGTLCSDNWGARRDPGGLCSFSFCLTAHTRASGGDRGTRATHSARGWSVGPRSIKELPSVGTQQQKEP